MPRHTASFWWIAVIAALICVGSLGPWSTILGETRYGLQTFGLLTFPAGAAILGVGVAYARSQAPRPTWPLAVMLVLGIASATLAGYDWWDTRQIASEADDLLRSFTEDEVEELLGSRGRNSVGWGVVLVFTTSVGIVLTSVVLLLRERAESPGASGVAFDSAAASLASSSSTTNDVDPTTGVVLATWLRRAVGGTVDLVVVAAISIPVLVWAATTENPSNPEEVSDAGALVALATLLLVGPLYQWLTIGRWGRSLGKAAVGVTVVRSEDAGRVSYGRALGRAASFEALAFLGITLLLAVLWPLWDTRRQTLYDKMAGTIVVRGRRPG